MGGFRSTGGKIAEPNVGLCLGKDHEARSPSKPEEPLSKATLTMQQAPWLEPVCDWPCVQSVAVADVCTCVSVEWAAQG